MPEGLPGGGGGGGMIAFGIDPDIIHKPTRRVNAKMSQDIFELHNGVVPIASGSFYVN